MPTKVGVTIFNDWYFEIENWGIMSKPLMVLTHIGTTRGCFHSIVLALQEMALKIFDFKVYLIIILFIILAQSKNHAQESDVDISRSSRPNIVFLMVDDLDVGSIETLLSLKLMPNLKKYLVDQGIKFSNTFVTNPVCCPSRATVLSGQYSHNHKTFSNSANNGSVLFFDDSNRLGSWLQRAGYTTAYVGKYLNAYGYFYDFKDNPDRQKLFRLYMYLVEPDGAPRMEPTYIPPGWDDWRGLLDLSTYCMYNYGINENGKIREYRKDGQILEDGVEIVPPRRENRLHNYQTDILTKLSLEFLINTKRNDKKPFFLSIQPLAPHAETCRQYDPDAPKSSVKNYKDQFNYQVRPPERHRHQVKKLMQTGKRLLPLKPSFNEFDIRDKPKELQRMLRPLTRKDKLNVYTQYGGRLASMISVDEMIGHLIENLKTLGEWDNTLFVFTSDNGWLYGEHRLSSKRVVYEESARVPLYIHLPGQRYSRQSDKIVLNNDFAPTFADLAGIIPPSRIDGRSIVPLFSLSDKKPWRKKFLIEHFLGDWQPSRAPYYDISTSLAVRTGNEGFLPNRVYIEYFEGLQKADGYYLSIDQKNPSGKWIWEQEPFAKEYYDLNQDPFEMGNLISQFESEIDIDQTQRALDQLKACLIELINCKGLRCRQLEDE